jgi:GTP pyrophosphokinase
MYRLLDVIRDGLAKSGIAAHVSGREKTIYSVYKKMQEKRYTFSQVFDIYGVRVLVADATASYAALGVLHSLYKPIPGKFKDYIAIPKANGYQSLHTTLFGPFGTPLEAQIRTHDMHRIAEAGVAAHWLYKTGGELDIAKAQQQTHRWLQSLLEIQSESRDSKEFLENIKGDLFPEEIYLFTPKGKIMALPRGATAVDFAYAIHTDVGHQCVGARVNSKMLPLRTPLKNGDIVEIVTQAKHKPSRDWLTFVQTSKARNKIKHFLQTEEKTRSIELGRKLFEKEVRRFDLNLKAMMDNAALTRAAGEYGMQKADDLFAAMAYGKLSARQVVDRLVPADQLHEKPEGGVVSAVRRALGGHSDRIKVRGADDVMVFRARCCNPIHGERIVGYITRGKGVSVHSVNCPNVTNLLYDPERRIDVEWDRAAEPAPYTVRLTVQVEDRRGMLAAVSTKVAGINTNITNVEAHTGEGQRGEINMTVEIRDLKHLEKVIKSLRGITGVIDVERAAR